MTQKTGIFMIVTRFAPSPTGYLHIGGARTALFNWLLARKRGGKFLLRIEDTDTKRNTPTAAQQVMDDMRWLGIDWDEGPDIGGPNGPYKQSDRRDIYDRYIQQLIDEQKAYYCFDTPEELADMRVAAEKEKRNNIYPRPDMFPDAAVVEKARAEGKPVTVRLAITQTEPIVIQDEVRGTISIDPAELSDFIIQKSDGFPTYHMAVVIDDELMGVTHIIRGQEHLLNTHNHQLLQKALGFRIPIYAHMSVTVSESGGKLSKRERPKMLKKAIKAMGKVDKDAMAKAGGVTPEELETFLKGKTAPDMPAVDAMAAYMGVHLPEINIVDFFRSGYLPETLVNFLALLGWNPGDGREIMTRDELIEAFDLSRINKSNSLFDRQKLTAFNTEYIKLLPPETRLRHFRAYLEEIGSPVAAADDELLGRIIRINEGARTLEQIEQKTRFAFVPDDEIEYDSKAVKKVLLKGDGFAMLRAVGDALATLDELTPEAIETLLRSLAEEKQVGLGKIAQPLRVAICGNTVSPPIFDTVDILGMNTVLKRIENTLTKFQQEKD
ncbi:MAG: glutamate--tRNA ligase [Planctomycetales bacterium 4572_13]|nr:MAG: glutamate--tRNA ligase [Planctomycetales bacterium 4572_13]